MSVLLHDRTKTTLDRLIAGRLGSLLFYGPEHVGKASLARELARQLACPHHHIAINLSCEVCRAFAANTYPDFHYLTPVDRPTITIEQVRRLTASLADRPYRPASVRSVLIDNADTLTIDAQNALLKLIEEPPAGTVIFLIANDPQGLLATIRSRCVALYFPSPQADQVRQLIAKHFPKLTPEAISQIVTIADNLPGRALSLAGSPDLLAADRELHVAAENILDQTLFERLLLATTLAARTQAELLRFARYLQTLLRARILDDTSALAAPNFAALERFRKRLNSGVVTKVATEALMLELTA